MTFAGLGMHFEKSLYNDFFETDKGRHRLALYPDGLLVGKFEY